MSTKKPFIEARRQQLLGEEHYKQSLIDWQQGLEQDLARTEFENDEYNCREASRWGSVAGSYFFLLFLAYTAGEPIENLGAMLEDAVAALEKEQQIRADYFDDQSTTVLGGGEESFLEALQYIGLSYLLHRRDLLPRIEILIYGIDSSNQIRDMLYQDFFIFNDLTQKPSDKYYNGEYGDLMDAMYSQNTKNEALVDLTSYVKDWYKMHKQHFWYDSHLNDIRLDNGFRYCGYWAFEAAAVAYLLDLDDSKLHKYLYYPKDLVAYARSKPAQAPVNNTPIALSAMPSTICTKAGIWFCPNDGLREITMKVGDTFPAADRGVIGEIIWYWKSE
jgi:Domain of unknown function (DUF1911)